MPFLRRRRVEKTEWTGVNQVTPATVGVNTLSTITVLSQNTLEEWPAGTVVRLLGSVFFSPATAPAAATGYGIFMGLYWAQNHGQGFDPETNLDFRWKWWNCIFPQIGGTAAADSNASRWIGYFPLHIDLGRSIRRKIDDFMELSFAIKNSVSSGASIQYSYAFRALIRSGR